MIRIEEQTETGDLRVLMLSAIGRWYRLRDERGDIINIRGEIDGALTSTRLQKYAERFDIADKNFANWNVRGYTADEGRPDIEDAIYRAV